MTGELRMRYMNLTRNRSISHCSTSVSLKGDHWLERRKELAKLSFNKVWQCLGLQVQMR